MTGTVERYPAGTTATIADFRTSGWKEVLNTAKGEDYALRWTAFSSAARSAVEAGELAKGKVLWLFSDICSMGLKPDSANEPFVPGMVWGDKRTVVPDDLEAGDVELLVEILPELDDNKLAARVSDILWLVRRPRDPKYAGVAIDAYRASPIEKESFVRDGREGWRRALRLAMAHRQLYGDRILEMEAALLQRMAASSTDDGPLPLWIVEILCEFGLGTSSQGKNAELLTAIAKEYENKIDYEFARSYFQLAADLYTRSGDKEQVADLRVRSAETWVKQSEARSPTATEGNMLVAHFLEKAIQEYRKISRSSRATRGVDERIAELHSRMSEAAERAVAEMKEIRSGAIDLSDSAQEAISRVSGLAPLDALGAFANISSSASYAKLKEQSEELIRSHPLQTLFSATHVARSGRVVAKREGAGPLEVDEKGRNGALWAEVVRRYTMQIQLVAYGRIGPALEVITREHRFSEVDFVRIARVSPFVPPGRERLFGKAIWMGFDGDFTSAVHVLVPQVENAVRFHLKAQGAKTTTLDSRGVETECGLSTLMELAEADTVLGEDLAFEIRALLCDSFGPNLRNELAHGLVEEGACESATGVYTWWLGCRLLVNPYLRIMENKSNNIAGADTEA